jgi:hypothetical protein
MVETVAQAIPGQSTQQLMLVEVVEEPQIQLPPEQAQAEQAVAVLVSAQQQASMEMELTELLTPAVVVGVVLLIMVVELITVVLVVLELLS